MSHLTRDERLLALDGALDAARQAHLAGCAACRAEIEALGGVLARVRAVEVPEPSPLFWDHLAARVGEAIAREPAPQPVRIRWGRRLIGATAALLVTAAGAGYLARHRAVPPSAAAAPVVALSTVTESAATDTLTHGDDDGWGLISAVADDAGAEALAPEAGQAELSIANLTAEERAALARELAAELSPRRGREG